MPPEVLVFQQTDECSNADLHPPFIYSHSQSICYFLRQLFRRILINCPYKSSTPHMLSCRIGLSPQKLPDSHVDNLAASWCPRIGSFTLWLKMFQAQEHAKEDGLRRVEASPTDADLGTLFPWEEVLPMCPVRSVTYVSGRSVPRSTCQPESTSATLCNPL